MAQRSRDNRYGACATKRCKVLGTGEPAELLISVFAHSIENTLDTFCFWWPSKKAEIKGGPRDVYGVSLLSPRLTSLQTSIRPVANPVGRIEHADFGFPPLLGSGTGGVNNLSDHVVNSPFMAFAWQQLSCAWNWQSYDSPKRRSASALFSGISRLAAVGLPYDMQTALSSYVCSRSASVPYLHDGDLSDDPWSLEVIDSFRKFVALTSLLLNTPKKKGWKRKVTVTDQSPF